MKRKSGLGLLIKKAKPFGFWDFGRKKIKGRLWRD
jgi:hypothetical protein